MLTNKLKCPRFSPVRDHYFMSTWNLISGQTHDLWNNGDDTIICLSCSQSCFFDPSTVASSCLKWIGCWISFMTAVLIACSASFIAYLSTFNIATVRFIFQLNDSTKRVLKDPTDREMSVLPDQIKCGTLIIKPNISISLMLDFKLDLL